jgi:hypothetical protein
MAQCSKCGFLAVWMLKEYKFREASKYFRDNGKPENVTEVYSEYQPQCFVQKFDLAKEAKDGQEYRTVVKGVIKKDRTCNVTTPWIQGFSPKEHKEMLLTESMLETQRRHADRSLWVAIVAASVTAISVLVGAYFTNNSAHLGAQATIQAAKMQIEVQREISKQTQPINVTVNIPDLKALSSKPVKIGH